MSNEFIFYKEDINKIAAALNAKVKEYPNNYRLEISNPERKTTLYLEIYSNIEIGDRRGNLISIYAPITHLQLHFCTGYIISDMLEEVTFISEESGKVSGLTVEKTGGCSLYANVNRKLLSGDFTKLGPEVMLSSIALSLAEEVLVSDKTKKS
jgi:hypothetical protein